MPNSQPQELIAALIPDDPFSMEFMETAQKTINLFEGSYCFESISTGLNVSPTLLK